MRFWQPASSGWPGQPVERSLITESFVFRVRKDAENSSRRDQPFITGIVRDPCDGGFGQASKGKRRMPWCQVAMKDVVGCDMPRGAAKQALIRGFPNGETHPGSCLDIPR